MASKKKKGQPFRREWSRPISKNEKNLLPLQRGGRPVFLAGEKKCFKGKKTGKGSEPTFIRVSHRRIRKQGLEEKPPKRTEGGKRGGAGIGEGPKAWPWNKDCGPKKISTADRRMKNHGERGVKAMQNGGVAGRFTERTQKKLRF